MVENPIRMNPSGEFRSLYISQARHGRRGERMVQALEANGGYVPSEGPYSRHLKRTLRPIMVSERESAQSELESMRRVVQELNSDSPDRQEVVTTYSNIDPEWRVSIRVGELIVSASKIAGVKLEIPEPQEGDWLSMRSESVMEALSDKPNKILNSVLRGARRLATDSLLNGDREKVLLMISDLIEGTKTVKPTTRAETEDEILKKSQIAMLKYIMTVIKTERRKGGLASKFSLFSRLSWN